MPRPKANVSIEKLVKTVNTLGVTEATKMVNRWFGMCSSEEAYSAFKAVRLHFNTDFDYFKYNGQTRTNAEELLNHKDRHLFIGLSRIADHQWMPYYCAVNFYHSPKYWVNDLLTKEAKVRFKDWQKKESDRPGLLQDELEDLKPKFRDLITFKQHEHPGLFTMVMSGKVDTTTMVILDQFMHFTDGWQKNLKGDPLWDGWFHSYRKFKPFVHHYQFFDRTTYKQIICDALGVYDESGISSGNTSEEL